MGFRAKFDWKRRDRVWARCCQVDGLNGHTDGTYCLCNLCGLPVLRIDDWDVSHKPEKPRAFGGEDVGVAHRRCNLLHGANEVTPAVAKTNRKRSRANGSYRPGSGADALPCSRRSPIKRKISGALEPRLTLAQKEARFRAKRGILYRPEA